MFPGWCNVDIILYIFAMENLTSTYKDFFFVLIKRLSEL